MKSISFVCTASIRKEASLCIYAIRRVYKDIPIYIGCDEPTEEYIKKLPFKFVYTKMLATPAILKLYKQSINKPHPDHVASHHQQEVIATKMDTLAWAVREASETLFIDSDVLIIQKVDQGIHHGAECVLSPHYFGWNRQQQSELYGVYNAGYLYVRNEEVADIWRDIFLFKSTFYEQQGMIWLQEHFDCYNFSRGHNVGFWRGYYPETYINGERKVSFDRPDWNWDYIYSVHTRLIDFGYKNNTIISRQDLFSDYIKENIPKDIVDYAKGESSQAFYIYKGTDIGSFSFIATKENKRESAVLIKSIRRLYSCPIYVLTDSTTSRYLRKFSFDDVYFRNDLEPSKLKDVNIDGIRIHNDFHNPKIIYKKMDCIDWALQSARKTLFLDSDIIITSEFHNDIDNTDVMVSSHFHEQGQGAHLDDKFGKYNAGYIWTKNSDLPKRWKDIYLNSSTFYEQKGMEQFEKHFNVSEFDDRHNIGFSRFRKEWDGNNLDLKSNYNRWSQGKSFHFHTFDEAYEKADKGLKKGYARLYDFLIDYIPEDIKEFMNDL